MGAMNAPAPVIALDHPAARDVARVGRKAAKLAAARAAGLPVGPGVVLTTDWATDDRATALQVWRITSLDGARPLAVRPSAAGADRRGWPDIIDPATVVHDADGALGAIAALRADDPTTPVLLQPHLAATWQGVLFADDAGGWRACPVAVVRGALGSDWIAELDHAARVRDVLSGDHDGGPPADLLGRLGRLAARVAAAFDGPHDLEWVADADGRLQLLRVRPTVRLHTVPAPRASEPIRRLVGTAA